MARLSKTAVAAAFVTTMILAIAAPSQAQQPDPFNVFVPGLIGSETHLRTSTVMSHAAVIPGQEFHVAVEVQLDKGWVFYSPMPGDVAKPAAITVNADALTIGEALWPPDRLYETDLGGGDKLINHVYKKHAVIYVPLVVPTDARPGKQTISILLAGQVCGNQCVDVNMSLSSVVTVGASSTPDDDWTKEIQTGLSNAVPAAKLPSLRPQAIVGGGPVLPKGAGELTVLAGLGLAFLAGLILNVMPCVLPVIPLRILSLTEMARQRRKRMVLLGLVFAAGMVLFFAILAILNVVLRLTVQHVFSLSDLFQIRTIRIALALVLVALAANLFGLFNVFVPGRLAGVGQTGGTGDHNGLLASLGMGLMMAVLATPCSFAILAKALAWAQVVPLWLGTVAILTIGLGMAAPHALLAAFPQLIDRLPRPGRWMELLKQSMGFVLLPVAIWLIFAGSDDTYPGWVIAYAVVLTMSLWIWGTWVRYDASLRRKIIIRGIVAVLALGAGIFMLSAPKAPVIAFEKFSYERLEAAERENRIVLVKFTSATCLSCIYLDRTVYSDPEVARELERRNVVTMKADTTDANTPASRMLKERFQGAPPLTVLLRPGGGKPIRLDGKFTKAELFEALINSPF